MCSCRAWRRWRSSYHLRFIAYVWHRAHSHPAGGKQWQGNLGFQRVDARQRLALHPFEERAARGRDKGEIVRYAGLVERRDRIAAARDRDQRSFARQRRGGPGERDGRSVEGRRLERAERAVPYQSAAILEHVGQRLDRRRTHVEDHLVGGDLMADRKRTRLNSSHYS